MRKVCITTSDPVVNLVIIPVTISVDVFLFENQKTRMLVQVLVGGVRRSSNNFLLSLGLELLGLKFWQVSPTCLGEWEVGGMFPWLKNREQQQQQ